MATESFEQIVKAMDESPAVRVQDRKHPLAKCEECPLYEVGRFVPSAGPAKAKLACVGEAPGVQEARQGVPFTGPSGKLLGVVLDHHGIDKGDVFLSNACLCRPPGNDTPPKAAILACHDRLVGELEDRGVEKVIALGNTACESLLGQSGVTKLRVGPPKQSERLPGIKIIPTIHPAACLRVGDQFPNLVADVGKVNYEPRVWNPPNFVVADTELDALRLLDTLDDRLSRSDGEDGAPVANPERVLVVDIEVDIDKDSAFGHPNQYGMLCVGIAYDRSKVLVLSEGVMESGPVRSRLGQLLRKYRIVAQNGKFDLQGLYPLLGPLELYFDTMLASYCFDERPGIHGLKYMAVELLGAPQYDEGIQKWVKGATESELADYSGYGRIPRDILYKYNAYDCACTFDVYLHYLERFEHDELFVRALPESQLYPWELRGALKGRRSLRQVHDHLVKASDGLMYLELNGIAIDRKVNNELHEEFSESLEKKEEEIDKIILPVGKDYDKKYKGINPRSPMQVKAYLADRGIMVGSTDENHLIEIQRRAELRGLPQAQEEVLSFVSALLDHRSEAKAHSTYVKGIAKRLYRGRLYSSFNLHTTTTGRLSSRNPNVQNIPRDSNIRRQFVPAKPEHLFLQTDYSQAELRVLSFLGGDTYFRNIFNDGEKDVFDDLTPILYPSKGTKEEMGAAAWKELRIRVKAFVYGLGYGRGHESIAKEFDIPEREALALKNNFFDVIPEIVDFQEDVKRRVHRGEDLVTPWGRHRRFPLITRENKTSVENEALAFLPQSTASDMCLQALYWTRPQIKGLGWIRNIVHDSLLIEGPEENMEELKRIAEHNMIESAKTIVGDWVKIEVESKIGKHWGEV